MSGYTKGGHFVAVYWDRVRKKGYSEYIHHSADMNVLGEAKARCGDGFDVVSLFLCKSRKEAEAMRDYEDVSFYRNASYLYPFGLNLYYPRYMKKDRLKELLREGA